MSFESINISITSQIYINKTLKRFGDIIYVIYLNDKVIFNEDSTKHQRYV